MGLATFGDEEFEFVSIQPEMADGPRPLQGTGDTVGTSYIWEALPDDLEELPVTDRLLIEEIWKGMLQVASSIMAESAHLDQVSTLFDFPTYSPRKWIYYEFVRTDDLSGMNANLIDRTDGTVGSRLLLGQESSDITYLEVAHGNRHMGAYLALDGPITERASVEASVGLTLRTVVDPVASDTATVPSVTGPEAWLLFGYGDLTKAVLAPGAYAAISTRGKVAAVSVRGDRTSRWAVSGESVDLTTEITLGVQVVGGDHPRVRATAGTVAVELDSDAEYRAAHLVLVAADNRVSIDAPNDSLFAPTIAASVGAFLGAVTWVDVSAHATTRYVPTLQLAVSNTTDRLTQDLDFEVGWSDLPADTYAEFRFPAPPTSVMWAENIGLDERLMEKVFGMLTGSPLSATDRDGTRLKNRIVGLLYGLLAGPTPAALSLAVGSLCGIPLVLEEGTVLSVGKTSLDTEVMVQGLSGKRRYKYPAGLTPIVRVGDTVTRLQPTCELPQVLDWTHREFVTRMKVNTLHPRITHEVEKYSAVLIDIPYGADGSSSDDNDRADNLVYRVREYLDRAIAIWTGTFRVFLQLIAVLPEQATLTDFMDMTGTLSLLDALTNGRDLRYNDMTGTYTDGNTDLYDNAYITILRDRLEVIATNTDAVPHSFDVFEVTRTLPAGDTDSYLEFP